MNNAILKDFFKNKLLSAISICLLAGIFLSLIFSAGVFEGWQMRLSDSLFTEKKPLDNIVILSIDDKSLQEIGRWPWDRQVFADMISRVSGDDPKVIGIDVAFFESSESDSMLADSMSRAGNVVLGVEYNQFILEEGKIKGIGLIEPVSIIKESAANLGYYNIPLDRDGVNRRANLNLESN